MTVVRLGGPVGRDAHLDGTPGAVCEVGLDLPGLHREEDLCVRVPDGGLSRLERLWRRLQEVQQPWIPCQRRGPALEHVFPELQVGVVENLLPVVPCHGGGTLQRDDLKSAVGPPVDQHLRLPRCDWAAVDLGNRGSSIQRTRLRVDNPFAGEIVGVAEHPAREGLGIHPGHIRRREYSYLFALVKPIDILERVGLFPHAVNLVIDPAQREIWTI